MIFDSIDALIAEGFTGFKTVAELREDRSCLPRTKGVYIVLYLMGGRPDLLKRGSGGRFKGVDKNADIEFLFRRWVDGTIVVYIGKAGVRGKSDKDSRATLHRRVGRFIDYGSGQNVSHQGGCYVWQIDGSENLVFCWKCLPGADTDPEGVECKYLTEFKTHFGRLPFANTKDCRHEED